LGARLGAATLAAPFFVLAVQAPAQARIPCRAGPGTTTIAHSAKARIFSDDRNGNDYACLYSNGHPRYLSSTEHFEYPLVRFAAPYVAYVPTIEAVPDDVKVMDMRTGRVHTYPSVHPIENKICSRTVSLAVKHDGAVAWIATNFRASGCEHPPTGAIEVRAHDKHGLRLLDSSLAVVPSSLRRSGSTLRWVDGGVTHTATLD
jgi:hypothetical protein